jgi:Ser/Thr protein kinase RdoA (MazF antagonist)
MDEASITRILQQYGYSPHAFLNVEKGYRNESHSLELEDGTVLNLILYKNEPGIVRTIRNANRASDYLASNGFPTRRTIDARIMHVQAGIWQKYAALYTYLPGQTIPWEAYTRNHIKRLGKMMSDIHASLQQLDGRSFQSVARQYSNLMEDMLAYDAMDGVQQALHNKLQIHIHPRTIKSIARTTKACERLPAQQVLHMDFVRSNILFADVPTASESRDKEYISGVLDFEKTAYGHPLFDIARTLAFLLVDCKYKSEEQVRKYFLYSGYQKRGATPLPHVWLQHTNQRVPLLERLVDLFLLYDLYKFLRHNPYESLPANEHYMRTRSLLLSRGLISETDDTIGHNLCDGGVKEHV